MRPSLDEYIIIFSSNCAIGFGWIHAHTLCRSSRWFGVQRRGKKTFGTKVSILNSAKIYKFLSRSQDWRCEACSCVMRDVLPPIGSSPSAVMDELESARQHNKVPAASGDKVYHSDKYRYSAITELNFSLPLKNRPQML